jgi:CDP-diacylglycerol--glycerol-3-phosphate 3-phosphatidyltransferase
MPTIYQLKPAFQNLLRPLVNQLARGGVTANQITLAAAALSVFAGMTIAIGHRFPWLLLLIPPILFLRMALNAMDGMLAREHGLKTPLGGILNELGDVVSDAALYLPFALIPGVSSVLVVPMVILAIISEMAGVLGVVTSGKRQYGGPMGKSDRAFFFSVVALGLGVGLAPGLWLNSLWTVGILLLLWTIFNRIHSSLEELENYGVDKTAG